uniref:Uncharacterized protein n=1 Tax=Glossina brevipalpis TaxID=37001 RepID=A0A1A9WTQ2_9MUSC
MKLIRKRKDCHYKFIVANMWNSVQLFNTLLKFNLTVEKLQGLTQYSGILLTTFSFHFLLQISLILLFEKKEKHEKRAKYPFVLSEVSLLRIIRMMVLWCPIDDKRGNLLTVMRQLTEIGFKHSTKHRRKK